MDPRFAQFRLSELEASRRAAARIHAARLAHRRHRAARPASAARHRYPDQQSCCSGTRSKSFPPELPVYALPPVHYGKSNEHIGFPGTLSVSASTFMAVLRDLGASISSAGFKKLVLYNTHGGNTSLIDVMARDLRAEFGLRTFALHGSGGIPFEGLIRRSAPMASTPAKLKRFSAGARAGTCRSLRLHRQLHRGRRRNPNCCVRKMRRPSLPGSLAISPQAACWATRVRRRRKRARAGSKKPPRKSPTLPRSDVPLSGSSAAK